MALQGRLDIFTRQPRPRFEGRITAPARCGRTKYSRLSRLPRAGIARTEPARCLITITWCAARARPAYVPRNRGGRIRPTYFVALLSHEMTGDTAGGNHSLWRGARSVGPHMCSAAGLKHHAFHSSPSISPTQAANPAKLPSGALSIRAACPLGHTNRPARAVCPTAGGRRQVGGQRSKRRSRRACRNTPRSPACDACRHRLSWAARRRSAFTRACMRALERCSCIVVPPLDRDASSTSHLREHHNRTVAGCAHVLAAAPAEPVISHHHIQNYDRVSMLRCAEAPRDHSVVIPHSRRASMLPTSQFEIGLSSTIGYVSIVSVLESVRFQRAALALQASS